MKQQMLIVALLLALTACGDETRTPASTDSAPTGAEASAPQKQIAPGALAKPLPEGIELGFKYYVNTEGAVETKTGVERYKVAIEFLDGDATAVLESILQSMADAGFNAGTQTEYANGNTGIKFTKADYGTVSVVIIPEPGDEPKNAAALGLVTLNFPGPRD